MLSGLLPTSEKTSTSTTSLVSAWTEGFYPLGFDEPQHQILQQPHQYLPVNRWQCRVPDRLGGGKSFLFLMGTIFAEEEDGRVDHQEGVSHHRERQMPV